MGVGGCGGVRGGQSSACRALCIWLFRCRAPLNAINAGAVAQQADCRALLTRHPLHLNNITAHLAPLDRHTELSVAGGDPQVHIAALASGYLTPRPKELVRAPRKQVSCAALRFLGKGGRE